MITKDGDFVERFMQPDFTEGQSLGKAQGFFPCKIEVASRLPDAVLQTSAARAFDWRPALASAPRQGAAPTREACSS